MCFKFFKNRRKKAIKKSKDGLHQTVINESSDLIKDNAKKLEEIISLYGDKMDEDTAKVLESVLSEIKYLNPSNRVIADDYDKKISNKIDDIKIALSKKEINAKHVEDIVFDIRAVIATRKTEL